MFQIYTRACRGIIGRWQTADRGKGKDEKECKKISQLGTEEESEGHNRKIN